MSRPTQEITMDTVDQSVNGPGNGSIQKTRASKRNKRANSNGRLSKDQVVNGEDDSGHEDEDGLALRQTRSMSGRLSRV